MGQASLKGRYPEGLSYQGVGEWAWIGVHQQYPTKVLRSLPR